MKILNTLLLSGLMGWGVAATATESLTGTQILKQIDANMVIKSAISETRMLIHRPHRTNEIRAKTWTQGDKQSLTAYLSPAREKGKKMLKLADKLWIYTPEPHDRIIKLSGHLLRQSVMGSDLSYEDMMSNVAWQKQYHATLKGKEILEGRSCYMVELIAYVPEAPYHKRVMWVDAERFIPLKQELFAKSGKLLKRLSMHDVKRFDGRFYPTRMKFKDMLSRGEGTEYIIEKIDFNPAIAPSIFTKASLRK